MSYRRRGAPPIIIPALLALLWGVMSPGSMSAQDAGDSTLQADTAAVLHAPRLYIDCNRCDMAHIRRELSYVNHVRDPAVAQIHVLVTDQGTGSGPPRFTLFFEGRDGFQGTSQTLQYTSRADDSFARQRTGLTRMLQVGLVPYLAQTPLASGLRVTYDANGAVALPPSVDPWNSWTFELYGGGNFNVDAARSILNARYGFYADRVTEEWKIRLRPYFNHNVRIFQTNNGEIRSIQRRHGVESHLIHSLGPNWGAGVFAEYITSTFENLRHRFSASPAIEYSLFPYDESSRRQITFSYRVGGEVVDYFEETIYEQTEETLFDQSLNVSVQYREPWGSVSAALRGSNYLHDMSHYRITFNSNVSVRIIEGVAVSLGANFQRINDQLSLPRGSASLEEILLQQRQLATSYRAWGDVGLTYRFGSIYSNVVNPRL
jgi:hypothetical protein